MRTRARTTDTFTHVATRTYNTSPPAFPQAARRLASKVKGVSGALTAVRRMKNAVTKSKQRAAAAAAAAATATHTPTATGAGAGAGTKKKKKKNKPQKKTSKLHNNCLLYTSDAADE